MHLKLNCTWRRRREFVTCKSSNVHGSGDESSSRIKVQLMLIGGGDESSSRLKIILYIETGTRIRHV